MALGRKTGGRQRGTPNRRTQDVITRLEALGCDPIEAMARIAMDDATPIEIRARLYCELAQYVAPKRRAIDVSEVGQQVLFQIDLTDTPARPHYLSANAQQLAPLSGGNTRSGCPEP